MSEHDSPPPPKYWAFISHSSEDRAVAEQLRRRLESFPVPKNFRGREVGRKRLGKRLRPIFRDRDEFSAAAALGPAIEGALGDSSCLIVLCSPSAARSQWVDQEIKYFRKLGRGDAILALIVSGEPNAASAEGLDPKAECFPPSLRYPFEPLAADLRKSGDGKTRGFLKIVAGVLEVGFDELWERYRRERRQRRIIVSLALMFVAGLVGLFAVRAEQASERAALQSARAENLAEKWLPEGSKPTPLITAIVNGDLTQAKAAAQSGESLSTPFSAEQLTPLMVACLVGHESVIEWLLSEGVSTDDTDRLGRLATHHAARAGQVGAIRLLAKHGIDVDPFAKGLVFDRPIDWAARDGLLPAVEALLDLGVPIEREVPPTHPFAMMKRASEEMPSRRNEPAERRKERTGTRDQELGMLGAGAMEPSHLLTSPILAAVETGQLEMLRYLIERGGKLKNAHPMGIEILKQTAMSRGHDHIVEFIRQQTKGDKTETATHSLAFHLKSGNNHENGFIKQVENLIASGAKPSLHMFFVPRIYSYPNRKSDYIRCFEIFLEHGADVEEKDRRGSTPLMRAAALPSLDWMIPLLAKAGTNLEARDKYTRTALMISAKRGWSTATKALIGVGADVHSEDKNGKTALIHACEKGDLEIVKMLVQAGAKIRYTHSQIKENGRRAYPERLDAIKSAESRKFDDIVEYLKLKLALEE